MIECPAFRAQAIRGTSGTPRHTKRTRYRCSLPGLAEFAGNRCTEPEVPPVDNLAQIFLVRDCFAESSISSGTVKGERGILQRRISKSCMPLASEVQGSASARGGANEQLYTIPIAQ